MERESSPPPEQERTEADFREKVRKIEAFPGLLASDKAVLLAVLKEAKPAMLHVFDVHDLDLEDEGEARRIEKNIGDFARLLDELGLPYGHMTEEFTDDEFGGGHSFYISFYIGKDAATAQRLERAHGLPLSAGATREVGLALGYTPTAAEAFAGHQYLPHEELPEEIRQSDLDAFIKYRVSRDHVDDDLELARRVMAATKEASPAIYEEIIRQHAQHKLDKSRG